MKKATVFTTLKAVKNIPSTLRINSEFPILNSAIEDALNANDAVVYVFVDNIYAATIKKIEDDYIRVYYNSKETKKFKINNELSLHRASFFVTRAIIADALIAKHLDSVEVFTLTIAK